MTDKTKQWNDAVGLAVAAIPTDDADWGSDRQVGAENIFYAAVENLVDFEHPFFDKATTEEAVAFTLGLVADSMNISVDHSGLDFAARESRLREFLV